MEIIMALIYRNCEDKGPLLSAWGSARNTVFIEYI